MSTHALETGALETGWRRFLDRLKQLWGRSRRGQLTPLSTAMTIARGRSAVAVAELPPQNLCDA